MARNKSGPSYLRNESNSGADGSNSSRGDGGAMRGDCGATPGDRGVAHGDTRCRNGDPTSFPFLFLAGDPLALPFSPLHLDMYFRVLDSVLTCLVLDPEYLAYLGILAGIY